MRHGRDGTQVSISYLYFVYHFYTKLEGSFVLFCFNTDVWCVCMFICVCTCMYMHVEARWHLVPSLFTSFIEGMSSWTWGLPVLAHLTSELHGRSLTRLPPCWESRVKCRPCPSGYHLSSGNQNPGPLSYFILSTKLSPSPKVISPTSCSTPAFLPQPYQESTLRSHLVSLGTLKLGFGPFWHSGF